MIGVGKGGTAYYLSIDQEKVFAIERHDKRRRHLLEIDLRKRQYSPQSFGYKPPVIAIDDVSGRLIIAEYCEDKSLPRGARTTLAAPRYRLFEFDPVTRRQREIAAKVMATDLIVTSDRILMVSTRDEGLLSWDLTEHEPSRLPLVNDDRMRETTELALLPDGGYLAALQSRFPPETSSLSIFDLRAGEWICELSVPASSYPVMLTFSGDGKHVLVYFASGWPKRKVQNSVGVYDLVGGVNE